MLYDVGLAETKGSGIKAMQRLMVKSGLAPPVLESDREQNRFVAYLLTHHFLSEEDIRWLSFFREFELTDDDTKALIVARELGAVDNATYRTVNSCDTLTASGRLRRMRDVGLLEQRGKGNQTYYRLTRAVLNPAEVAGKGGVPIPVGGVEAVAGGGPSLRGGPRSLNTKILARFRQKSQNDCPTSERGQVELLCNVLCWNSARGVR